MVRVSVGVVDASGGFGSANVLSYEILGDDFTERCKLALRGHSINQPALTATNLWVFIDRQGAQHDPLVNLSSI